MENELKRKKTVKTERPVGIQKKGQTRGQKDLPSMVLGVRVENGCENPPGR